MLQGSQRSIAWGDAWQSMWMLERQQCRRDTAMRRARLLAQPRLTNALALNWIGERDGNCARAEPLPVIPGNNERRVR
jgi:hypothetical protein